MILLVGFICRVLLFYLKQFFNTKYEIPTLIVVASPLCLHVVFNLFTTCTYFFIDIRSLYCWFKVNQIWNRIGPRLIAMLEVNFSFMPMVWTVDNALSIKKQPKLKPEYLQSHELLLVYSYVTCIQLFKNLDYIMWVLTHYWYFYCWEICIASFPISPASWVTCIFYNVYSCLVLLSETEKCFTLQL